MSLLPPPNAFGLPDKFNSWREHQDEAVLEVVDDHDHRVNLQVAPTGFGKSLAYIMMAVLRQERAVILTSTKGLQTQLLKDFESIGAVDVRGKNAYRCLNEIDGTMCDRGICNYGFKCPLRDSGCLWHDAVRAAKLAPIVISNYAFWMTMNEHVEGGLGKFKFIVCDEAHDVPDTVSSYLTVIVDLEDSLMRSILPRRSIIFSMKVEEWIEWANQNIAQVATEIDAQKDMLQRGSGDKRRLRKFQKLHGVLKKMCAMQSDWIMGHTDWTVEFAPKWPAPYCEDYLFLNIPRILLTSASVRKKTADMLGLEDVCMTEYPHTFPRENRMLYYVPTVWLNFKTPPEELKVWLMRIDQICGARRDRKGIIHTVSYTRRNFIMAGSKHADLMITHQRKNTVQTVEKFKRSNKPLILVSPSMTTGWDFPYDECRYQIITKLPYPDISNPLVKARKDEDKDYVPYVTMQQLTQECGRPIRAPDDWGENLVIDNNIVSFMKYHRTFAPDYFWQAYEERATIPPPRRI